MKRPVALKLSRFLSFPVFFHSESSSTYKKSIQTFKQGRSSSIGAKNLSIVLRQLTEDFKEKTLKKNLPTIEYRERGAEGREVCLQEK